MTDHDDSKRSYTVFETRLVKRLMYTYIGKNTGNDAATRVMVVVGHVAAAI